MKNYYSKSFKTYNIDVKLTEFLLAIFLPIFTVIFTVIFRMFFSILFTLTAINLIYLGFAFFIFLNRWNNFKKLFTFKPTTKKILPFILLLTPLVVIFSDSTTYLFNFSNERFTTYISNIIEFAKFNNNIFHNLLIILNVAVIPAIFEEMLFRGLILFYLLRKLHPLYSILLSSVIFALYHFEPALMIQIFILGIILAIIAFKSKNIIFSMLIHFFNNATVLLLLNIKYNKAPITKLTSFDLSLPIYIIIDIITFIVLIAFLKKETI